MSGAIVLERRVTALDTQLSIAGVLPADGGAAYVEIRTLRRPVSSVGRDDFTPIGEPLPVPLHLMQRFTDECKLVALRTAEAALVAPAPRARAASKSHG